jgi:hypothetical protein
MAIFRIGLVLSLALAAITVAAARADPVRIVLVAAGERGRPGNHEYSASVKLLARALETTSGVRAETYDGWPATDAFDGARAVVFYSDGGTAHPLATAERVKVLEAQLARGAGLVTIHAALDGPASVHDALLGWLGVASARPPADSEFDPGWTAGYEELATHPITRGVAPFTLEDQWIAGVRLASSPKVHRILEAAVPEAARQTDEAELRTTAWAFERADGGRSFATTGGHYRESWDQESFRRLVTNGILWAAGIE